MFSTISGRLTPAGVISVIALVFAMLGGAYAAQGSGDSGKATASAKAKRGPRGPKGPAGPQGLAGPQGPAGPKGDAGTNGTSGTNGISPQGTAFSGEAHGCKEGGVEFKGANTTFVCNGVEGSEGETGFTETLPPGKTEFGQWSMQIASTGEGLSTSSFNIPLSSIPTVILIPEGEEEKFETECPGTASSPAAAEGYACFYTFFSAAGSELKAESAIPSAQGVTFSFRGTEGEAALGSWAVTAE